MISIELIEDIDRIKNILCDPILFSMTRSGDRENFVPDLHSTKYLIATKDDTDIAVLEIEPFTDLACVGHNYFLPKYWGTGLSDKVAKKWAEWLLEKTNYETMLAYVPKPCANVMLYMQRLGYEPVGKLDNIMTYGGVKTTLYVFRLDLNKFYRS